MTTRNPVVTLSDVEGVHPNFKAKLNVNGQFLAYVSCHVPTSQVNFRWRFQSSTLEDQPLYQDFLTWVESLPPTEDFLVFDEMTAVLSLLP